MSPILKLSHDDEEKELDFELEYQMSLTVEKRFEMMFEKSKKVLELLQQHGHRKSFKIIKRT